MTIQIVKIKIKQIPDDNPDYSSLGSYTDDLEPGVIVRAFGEFYEKLPAPINRDSQGKFTGKGIPYNLPSKGREYRGFIPYAGGEPRGTYKFYHYGMRDFERMEAINRGEILSIGILAEAVVKYPIDGGHFRYETLSSSGIWGIDSDSDMADIVKEELSELKEHLKVFGVDVANFEELAQAVK